MVEETGDAPGEVGETIDIDVLSVHGDAQGPPSAPPGQLEVVQLEFLRGEVGLDHLPDVFYLRHFLNFSTRNQVGAGGAHLTEQASLCWRRL